MIMPSDKTYQRTKEIMQGKAEMNPDFRALADFVDRKFKVKVVNMIYGFMDSKKRPYLNICFEFEQEEIVFRKNKEDCFSSFDKRKQEIIVQEFTKIADRKKYRTKDMWIYFSAFKPIAQIEAMQNITREQKDQFIKQLNNKDIWTINNAFSTETFFVYTEKQRLYYENSPIPKEWARKYYEVIKQYDEFDYFDRDTFSIRLDSKENFDTNYQSNWWYYYK